MNRKLIDKLKTITSEEKALIDGNELDRKLYTSSSRFLVDSARLLRSGEMIRLRPHTRFIEFPLHRHNYIEITYMISGKTLHTFAGGEQLILQTGELLLMNPHAEHGIDAAREEDLAVNIIVMPAFFDAVFSLIGHDNILGKFLMNALRNQDMGFAHLHFRVAEVSAIQLIMESMIHNLIEQNPNNTKINQISMSLLFMYLLNASDCLQFLPDQRQVEGVAVLALREIDDNYAHASLTELAKRHGYSISYMSRVIKKATGYTFAELLQKKRVDKAADLLLQTSLSIEEIIHAVGYHNSSHFYRLFEGLLRMSPGEYRKKSVVK